MQSDSRSDRVEFQYSTDESKITELAGVKLSDYYWDLDLMVEAQRQANDVLRRELGIERKGFVLSSGHVRGPEYLGARIHWPEDEEPMIAEPALREVTEVRAFHLPDPPDNPVARRGLERARQFFELTGHRSSISWEGALSTATLAFGSEAFYYLAADDPGLCERFLATITEAMIAWRRWHDAEIGLDPTAEIYATDDTSSFLSPGLWRRFALPNLLRWYEAFPCARERNLHICGDTNHVLDQIALLGLAWFDLGEMVDLARAKRLLPDTTISRLWDFKLIRDGTPDEIREYSLRELAIGASGGSFVAHVEGWRGVPLAKVRVVKETVEEWNRAV